MNCPYCERYLEDFLEDLKDLERRKEFQAHLEHCDEGRNLLEDVHISRDIMHSAFPAGEWQPSPHFFSKMWRTIEAERSEPFSWVALRDLAFRFTAGVALIIALLIGIDAMNGPHLNANQAAINTYLEAPGATDSFRDILIGDVDTNRDQLLRELLERDRQQNASPISTHEAFKKPNQKK